MPPTSLSYSKSSDRLAVSKKSKKDLSREQAQHLEVLMLSSSKDTISSQKELSLLEPDLEYDEAFKFVDSTTSTQKLHYDSEQWAPNQTEPGNMFKSGRKQRNTSKLRRKENKFSKSAKRGESIEACVDHYIEKLENY